MGKLLKPFHLINISAEKSINYSSNTVRPPSTYQTQQANKVQKQAQQFISKNLSNPQQSTKNLYTSYAAPASGSAPFLYSQPQLANQVPLPTLFPKSLVEHLSPGAQMPTQMQMQQLQQRQQQQLKQQQQSLYTDYTKQLTSDLPLVNTPLLMVEEPTSSLLTPSQNLTLEAARILASTLLEANGEAPLETPGLAPLSNPKALELPNKLNNTDVLILKSQKNAYIIPAPLAKGLFDL